MGLATRSGLTELLRQAARVDWLFGHRGNRLALFAQCDVTCQIRFYRFTCGAVLMARTAAFCTKGLTTETQRHREERIRELIGIH